MSRFDFYSFIKITKGFTSLEVGFNLSDVLNIISDTISHSQEQQINYIYSYISFNFPLNFNNRELISFHELYKKIINAVIKRCCILSFQILSSHIHIVID